MEVLKPFEESVETGERATVEDGRSYLGCQLHYKSF